MFSNAMVAFLAALGGGAWIYAKMLRQTGNNTKSALTVAACGAGLIFLLILTILQMIF